MNRRIAAFLSLMLTLVGCALTPADSHIPGYLTSPRGSLLKNADDQCWRTADWRPALAIAECDPALVAELLPEPPLDEVEEPVEEEEQSVTVLAEEGAASADRTAISAKVRDALPLPLDDTLVIVPEQPVSLSGDATFHFGQSYLTPKGKEAVQFLVNAIQRQQLNTHRIEVVGHSDRTGRRELNMTLSRQRAEEVKRAMVSLGIPAAIITTSGVGPDQPVTTLAECPAHLSLYELIGCLVEDRRVEIRVKGSRPR